MKIKVSFTKIVEADSIGDAYGKFLLELYKPRSQDGIQKQFPLHGNKIVVEMNGFVFEDLGEHSGYGEGSIGDWTDIEQ